MKNGVIRVCVAAVIGLVLGASLAAPLLADDFYKGKRIRLLIGQNPGTSYDISARLVGRHIVRHIPGNPGLITQNMPGATGLIAANFVFNIAPKELIAEAKKAMAYGSDYSRCEQLSDRKICRKKKKRKGKKKKKG